MVHKKEFSRENGTKLRIEVRADISETNNQCNYFVHVEIKLPKKRFWENITDKLKKSRDYQIALTSRKLRLIAQENLKFVTREEIHEVKLELWEKMKPVSDCGNEKE